MTYSYSIPNLIEELAINQNIILFGASSGMYNFIENNKNYLCNIKYIVDNDSKKWGERKYGLEIKKPSSLKEEDKNNIFIYITSQHYEEITIDLENMGFIKDNHFRSVLPDFSTLYPDKEIIVTYSNNDIGSIYKINLKNDTIEKIIEIKSPFGKFPFRDICKTNDGYAVINRNSIYFFDELLNEYEEFVLSDNDLDLHGIEYSEGFLYIVETATNTIKVMNAKTLNIEKEVNFKTPVKDLHHINDICVDRNSLYISMISLKGIPKPLWWDSDDGVIIEVDKHTFEVKQLIKQNLKFPHSVKFFNNQLHYCESKDCSFSTAKQQMANFNGFTRGLDYDGFFYYIGQSSYRGKPYRDFISKDAGVYIYDPISGFSRFIKLSTPEEEHGNVYAVLSI
jgi:hypothetical protein